MTLLSGARRFSDAAAVKTVGGAFSKQKDGSRMVYCLAKQKDGSAVRTIITIGGFGETERRFSDGFTVSLASLDGSGARRFSDGLMKQR